MSLLKLCDLGKIYVSDGNVSVGIRGVNLSFEKGEFVAVTGKSGSGKSTLLNVISGMDSYEEGELYIEGQTTSHYLQPEWEEYREKYISFIFQDYNIIDSFTVLQNVELALMHIDDKKERRKRALELIDRVGLSSHVRHKGSRLSGGQKQRTVIARALAKDSPIILADEPTGNLDSATSKDIIRLLKEVSEDKLVIVVTHNFDQLEEYATRHIRIFDGAVESDHTVRSPKATREAPVNQVPEKKKRDVISEVKKGFHLGKTIFISKPRLSIFLCLLMVVGTLGIFAATSLFGEATKAFEEKNMFTHIDGRVVITKRDGSAISEDELKRLTDELGAESYLHYDVLLDTGNMGYVQYTDERGGMRSVFLQPTFGEDFGNNIVGEYPDEPDEVLLYAPISLQPVFGRYTVEKEYVSSGYYNFKVSGIKYFYDNNKQGKMLFTEEGFRLATGLYYINQDMNISVTVTRIQDQTVRSIEAHGIIASSDQEKGKITVYTRDLSTVNMVKDQAYKARADITVKYVKNNHYYDSQNTVYFKKTFDGDGISAIKNKYDSSPANDDTKMNTWYNSYVMMNPEDAIEISEELMAQAYTQASLFFQDDRQAREAVGHLNDEGYMAVPSDTTYSPNGEDVILGALLGVFMILAWLIFIIFLAFFLNLCSSRTLAAFKGDMAIMRSMGIPVRTIRIAMYARMLISLIPAFIILVFTAFFIFLSPKYNAIFTYLYFWQYLLIAAGMLILTSRVTYKQIKKLFRTSVKKSLRGGAAE